MNLHYNNKFVFDLDDTLYSEREFEKSGIEFVYNFFEIKNFNLNYIVNNRVNWIEQITSATNKSITWDMVLEIYRNHFPAIHLYKDSKIFLDNLLSLGCEMSLITDGRSITQRNKLRALEIDSYFKSIIISEEVNSEKPSEYNYKLVMDDNQYDKYVYIADNPKKDFITPNKLGWTSVCLLDRGQNVHKQFFTNSNNFNPHFIIKSFDEINIIY